MTFDELLDKQQEKYVHKWTWGQRCALEDGWNAAIEESAKVTRPFQYYMSGVITDLPRKIEEKILNLKEDKEGVK